MTNLVNHLHSLESCFGKIYGCAELYIFYISFSRKRTDFIIEPEPFLLLRKTEQAIGIMVHIDR